MTIVPNSRRVIEIAVLLGAASVLVAVRMTIGSGQSSPSISGAAPALPSAPTSSSTSTELYPPALIEPPVLPLALPSTSVAGPAPASTPRVKQLALLAFSCSTDPVSITCTGSVKNLTDTPLNNVVALVDYHDENLVPVNQDAGPLSDTSILPGQTSSWTVVGSANSLYIYERVLFVDMGTNTLYTLEDDTG